MRNLAARLGVRASSLYRHFPDRSSIERTLANRAAEQLLAQMQLATDGLTGEKALFAALRAYLDYASAESYFYDMMMQSSLPPHQSSDALNRIWKFFIPLVSSTTDLGEDVSGAAALWSFLHGFTVLARSGQLGDTAPNLTFARGTQALVCGLSVSDTGAAGASA